MRRTVLDRARAWLARPLRLARLETPIVLLVAGAVWSIEATLSLLGLLSSYALAWVAVNVARVVAPRGWAPSLTRGQAAALACLLALPPAARLWDGWGAFEEHEHLDAGHIVESRLRLERTPQIHPSLVSAAQPQTFYVHAPGGSAVAVSFGGPQLAAVALGHGVFRLEYDPRRDGLPSPDDGPLIAQLVVDGEAHRAEMLAVRPRPHPGPLAPSPARLAAATTSEPTDELLWISRTGHRRMRVGDGPSDLAFVSENGAWVAHRYGRHAWLVDPEAGRVIWRTEVGAFGRAVAARGGLAVVARGGLTPELVSIEGREVRARSPLPFRPDDLALAADDRLLVTSRRPAAVHRFARADDGGWRADGPPLLLGRPAVTLAVAPDGRTAQVVVTDLRLDGAPHTGNHFVDDQILTIDVASLAVVNRERTAARTPRQRAPGDVDRGLSPIFIDLPPDGSRLVAFAGSDDVTREPPGGLRQRFTLDKDPLAAPLSAVALSGGGFVVSSGVYGALGRFDAEGSHIDDVRFAPHDRALLREDQRALQRRIGERSFYEGTRSGVSCQSCHLHGESDGALHNIGDHTLVATLDVRGLRGTPPYLRDGGYPTLGSLDGLARTLYQGYLRRQSGRRASLDRYLESLARPPPFGQLEERDLERERRGLDAFFRARCHLCHAPPAFTNLGQHAANAVFPSFARKRPRELDTPSLLGLGGSAPYLVDGRAATLRDIFLDHDPDGRHGYTVGLSEAELGELLAFLEDL